MDKIELFYNIVDGGDGSASIQWYTDEEVRDAAIEDGNYSADGELSLGEGSVETYRGSDIHMNAMDYNQ